MGCYNWPNCKGTDCTSNSNGGKLADLEAACAADVTCGWVSCHADPNDPTNCQRYMFSHTCDVSTQDLELDWSIHQVGKRCYNWPNCKGTDCTSNSNGENLLILRLNVRQTLIAVGFLATPTRTTRPIAKGTCSAVRVISRLKILSLIGASTRRLRSNDAVCKN